MDMNGGFVATAAAAASVSSTPLITIKDCSLEITSKLNVFMACVTSHSLI